MSGVDSVNCRSAAVKWVSPAQASILRVKAIKQEFRRPVKSLVLAAPNLKSNRWDSHQLLLASRLEGHGVKTNVDAQLSIKRLMQPSL